MKKFVILTVIIVGVFAAFGQEKVDKPKKKRSKVPYISFEYTVYDYGIVEKNGDGMCEFVFKNTGKEDLILTNVRSSCGCTVPEWPKEPIPKKKKAVIKVKYNTNNVGTINKSITVESNAENNRVILYIKGRVSDTGKAEAVPENTQSPVHISN
ncbi:DUF1573 domain-containing protein [Bacteroidales bacterium OttesenSCG-928-L19]|nr:DUF1573 domain-containing protein [Bacteroidales bacterium OttesenSCG-928-L19]